MSPIARIAALAALLCLVSPVRLAAHEASLHRVRAALPAQEADENEADENEADGDPAEICRLTLDLVDSETGKPLPGLVRAIAPRGRAVSLGGLLERGVKLSRQVEEKRWHVLLGRTAVSAPREVLTFQAFHGIETEVAERRLDLREKEKAELTLRLRRFSRAAGEGLYGGNTHLHLMRMSRSEADRYLASVPRADGLDVVFLSYLERLKDDATYISNTYTAADLRSLSRRGVLFGNGEEHRHNFGAYDEGYGHVMFLDIEELVHPVSIGPGISGSGTDGLTLRRGIETVRRKGGTTIWCHNRFGLEDIPDWLAGVLDAQNIFDGGEHGSYEDTFYRYLNVGLRVPFSTGTDWFIYDFSRAYVEVEGELTVERWLRGLAAGRSFITNGTLLDFEVDGKRPGRTLSRDGPSRLEVRGRAAGRNDFKKLELVRDGEVVHATESSATGRHFVAEMRHTVDLSTSGWLALRISGAGENELGKALFAHTSPVYVDVKGSRRFVPAVARELIGELRENLATIRKKAHFASDDHRRAVERLYEGAIQQLEERLRAHEEAKL